MCPSQRSPCAFRCESELVLPPSECFSPVCRTTARSVDSLLSSSRLWTLRWTRVSAGGGSASIRAPSLTQQDVVESAKFGLRVSSVHRESVLRKKQMIECQMQTRIYLTQSCFSRLCINIECFVCLRVQPDF